jgi:hypothetical protein
LLLHNFVIAFGANAKTANCRFQAYFLCKKLATCLTIMQQLWLLGALPQKSFGDL